MQSKLKTIVKAGLLVGTLDILAAFLHYFIRTGKNPLPILKFIASGVFGKAAFSGGNSMLAWGLLFHYLIAFLFTLFFFWIVPKLKFLTANKIVTGVLYGIFVWVVMNLVVLPLSNTPKLPFDFFNTLIGILILILCVGLPLSFIFFKRTAAKASS